MLVDSVDYARPNDPDADGEYVDEDASPAPSNSHHPPMSTHPRYTSHQADSVSLRHLLLSSFLIAPRIRKIQCVMIDRACV